MLVLVSEKNVTESLLAQMNQFSLIKGCKESESNTFFLLVSLIRSFLLKNKKLCFSSSSSFISELQ